MTQWSEHSPHVRRYSLYTGKRAPQWSALPPSFPTWAMEREQSSRVRRRRVLGPARLLTLKLVCTGPRIYSSVNNDNNYTQGSQDQKGKSNRRKETETKPE